MEDDEVVHVKVFDNWSGDVLFYGKVSTDVKPYELSHLGCFHEQGKNAIFSKATKEEVKSFKGMQNVELIASYGSASLMKFSGVLYQCDDDGVLRSSKTVPSCECVIMSVWNISHEECVKVFKCETLEDLDINNCELRQIPNDIGKMKKLKKVRLYGLEQLRSIPEEIGDLSSLKELTFLRCGVECLPNSIGGLKQLEQWYLINLKNLKSIPEELCHLSNLKKLIINMCKIQSLPKSMKELKQLKCIGIYCLSELEIDANMMSGFARLKIVHVASCDKLFQGNGANSFCEMLKMSVDLQHLHVDWEHEKKEMLREALLENGSITEGTGEVVFDFSDIFERNKANHARAMLSVVCMIAIRRCGRALSAVPREIIDMLAKMLWITRCDVEAWMVEERSEKI